MFKKIQEYLAYQGVKYMKAEKAGNQAHAMEELKKLGQAAREEMQTLSKHLDSKISGFVMARVSNWANQAQIARPHFWCFFIEEGAEPDDIAFAIRLYGNPDDFGISVEVSFVERKKSEKTLTRQHRVLSVAIAEPLYYMVQIDGVSHREDGNESNRLRLQEEVKSGKVRKVLMKYDISLNAKTSLDEIIPELIKGFKVLMPYYQATKKD